MIEAGRAYVSANKLFVNGIKDLSQQCKKEEMISVSGSCLGHKAEQYLHSGILDPLSIFVRRITTVQQYKLNCKDRIILLMLR